MPQFTIEPIPRNIFAYTESTLHSSSYPQCNYTKPTVVTDPKIATYRTQNIITDMDKYGIKSTSTLPIDIADINTDIQPYKNNIASINTYIQTNRLPTSTDYHAFFTMIDDVSRYLNETFKPILDDKISTMTTTKNDIISHLTTANANQYVTTKYTGTIDALNGNINIIDNNIALTNANIDILNANIETITNTYNTTYTNALRKISSLFDSVQTQNNNVNNQVQDIRQYLTTNDRNAKRLNEIIDNYRIYYYYLFIVYYCLLGVALLLVLLKYNQGWRKLLPEICMVLLLGIFPFFMTQFEMYLINFIKYIVSFVSTTPYRKPTDPDVDPTNDPNQFAYIGAKDDYTPKNTEYSQEKTPTSPWLFFTNSY